MAVLNADLVIDQMLWEMSRPSKQSMLSYCKTILRKMSFSKRLFLKEYRKSLSYLSAEEQNELRRWIRQGQEQEIKTEV
jgi:hypothetical protein